MVFENYAKRIKRLRNDLDQSEPIETITQKRLQVHNLIII